MLHGFLPVAELKEIFTSEQAKEVHGMLALQLTCKAK